MEEDKILLSRHVAEICRAKFDCFPVVISRGSEQRSRFPRPNLPRRFNVEEWSFPVRISWIESSST